MKISSFGLFLRAVVAMLISLPSCKKDKKETPQPAVNCDLLIEQRDSFANGNISTTTYEYDSQDRLVKQTSGSNITTVEYLDNGKTVKETSTSYRRTFTLNDAGRITKLRTESSDGSITEAFYTIVNGYTQMIIEKYYPSEGAVPSIDTTTFQNTVSSGNLVKVIVTKGVNVTVLNINYDLSKPADAMKYPAPYSMYISELTGPSANLLNYFNLSGNNGNQSVQAVWELDAKGRVSKQTSTSQYDNDPPQFQGLATYKYRCN